MQVQAIKLIPQPVKAIKKDKPKPPSESADESDTPAPAKTKKAKPTATEPLGDSGAVNKATKPTTIASKHKAAESETVEKPPKITVTETDDGAGGEKKKKRKLFGTQAAFKWDPILEVSTDLKEIMSEQVS